MCVWVFSLYLFICWCYLLGRFQQFDHGYTENMKRYQSAIPPQYNLNHVQTRLHVIFGSNDNLVSSKVCSPQKHTHCSFTFCLFICPFAQYETIPVEESDKN